MLQDQTCPHQHHCHLEPDGTQVPQMEDRKKTFIEGNLQLNMPPKYQTGYTQMVIKHHKVVRQTQFDLLLTAKILH